MNAFGLKMVMAVLMLLDHLYYPLGGRYPVLYWGHIAARVVAPVFCYLMTEGMRYTRDRSRYVLRLFAAGLLMQAGNMLLASAYGVPISNNIFLPLAVGAAMIALLDRAKRQGGFEGVLLFVLSLLLLALSLPMESGPMVPVMALIFYGLRPWPVAMWLAYFGAFCMSSLLYLLTGQIAALPAQFWMCLAVFPILLYNGQRGPGNAFAKYFFYFFYPIHVWLIYLWEQVYLRWS